MQGIRGIYKLAILKKFGFFFIVTLTPEVDSQVSSTMEGGGSLGGVGGCAVSREDAVQNVIPPTTIVCLPSATPAPIPQTAAQPGVVSSSAVPYLALTTSAPVRALPTKPKVRQKLQ